MLHVLCFVPSLGSGVFAPRAQPIQVHIVTRGSQLLPGAVSPGSLDGALPLEVSLASVWECAACCWAAPLRGFQSAAQGGKTDLHGPALCLPPEGRGWEANPHIAEVPTHLGFRRLPRSVGGRHEIGRCFCWPAERRLVFAAVSVQVGFSGSWAECLSGGCTQWHMRCLLEPLSGLPEKTAFSGSSCRGGSSSLAGGGR